MTTDFQGHSTFHVEMSSCACHLNKSHYLLIFDTVTAQGRGGSLHQKKVVVLPFSQIQKLIQLLPDVNFDGGVDVAALR